MIGRYYYEAQVCYYGRALMFVFATGSVINRKKKIVSMGMRIETRKIKVGNNQPAKILFLLGYFFSNMENKT